MPFLVTTGNEPTRERIQSQARPRAFDDTTKCILCAACTTSCPVYWSDGQYFGPQAIVGAHRFIFDSRDEGSDQRLEILNDSEGVWRCRTTFNCTEACPAASRSPRPSKRSARPDLPPLTPSRHAAEASRPAVPEPLRRRLLCDWLQDATARRPAG
jgi:ferredoxin